MNISPTEQKITATPRPGFTARPDNCYAPCMGASGHRHSARIGTCDGCGLPVGRMDNGRLLNLMRDNTRIACWLQGHECNPEHVETYTAFKARQLFGGEVVKGQIVTVVKGRKVPIGTTGVVMWVGIDSYDKPRVGFRTADGENIFTATSNVKVTA